MGRQTPEHHRAIAERNVESILDAAERLLERGGQATIARVATEAEVSRVTVYAHFPTRELLLEAVLDRAVRRAVAAVEAADLDSGSAVEALDRVIAVGWLLLHRFSGMARATAEGLSAERRRQLHEPGFAPIRRLFERGQREGAFRPEVPIDWLVACFYALVHAAIDEVGAGRLDPASAPAILSASLRDLAVGRSAAGTDANG